MTLLRRTVLALLLLFGSAVLAENEVCAKTLEWRVFNTQNSGLPDNQIQSIAVGNQDAVWIATAKGLSRFDGKGWTTYDPSNSGLPDSYVQCVQPDKQGNVWVGTMKGVSSFDGNTWTTYSTDNSPLPSNNIAAIHADAQGRVWIATAKGLAVVDGSNWAVYNAGNSLILDDLVLSVVVDSSGTAWIGTFDSFQFNGRLLRFDGSTWKRYRLELYELNSSFPVALTVDEHNVVWMGVKGTAGGAVVKIDNGEWTVFRRFDSEFPGSAVQAIVQESSCCRWMATAQGLVLHDGEYWTVLDQRSAGLPDEPLTTVAVDSRGNKWVGMLQGGVAVYNKSGVVTTSTVSPENTEGIALLGSFPNPCGASAHIRYRLGTAGYMQMSVCDLFGKEVAVPAHGYYQAGEYLAVFDAAALPEGIYICSLQTAGRTQAHTIVKMK